MYVISEQETFQKLSTAIVEQACYDYIVFSEQITRETEKGDCEALNIALAGMAELVQWFQSDEFRSISPLNASQILAGLEEAIAKGVTIDGIEEQTRL